MRAKLAVHWKASVRDWDAPRMNEITAYGETITQDELERVTRRVWPDS